VRVEVAITFGSSKAVSEVTNANPAVATSTAHGLAAGSVGYFSAAAGMESELQDGMAVSVKGPDTNTFQLEGIDASNWGNFTSGTFVPVSAWATLSESTGYEITGGDRQPLDVTTLLDEQGQEDTSQLGAQRVQVNNFSNPQGTALAFIEEAARDNDACIFRITFPDGSRRIWRGVPSLPGESLSVGQMATSGFSTTVRGRLHKLAAAS